MTYLLGELLKHRNFPPKLVVAASGKDPTLRYAPSQVGICGFFFNKKETRQTCSSV